MYNNLYATYTAPRIQLEDAFFTNTTHLFYENLFSKETLLNIIKAY